MVNHVNYEVMSHRSSRAMGVIPALAFTLTLTASIKAQEILRIVDGRRGSELTNPHFIDDLDNDGVADVLVHGAFSFGLGQGTFFVISGATGAMIWGPYYPANLPAGLNCGRGGAAVLGDFDGDGTTDIAVGCGTAGSSPGHVVVLSGLDGHEIVRIPNPVPQLVSAFGSDVGALGDVNADGFNDLIVATEEDRQDVHLGPNGAFAYSVSGPSWTTEAGLGVGDLNLDGKDDFVVGWWNSGVASVHSGADGAVLAQFCMSNGPFSACGGRMGPTPVALGDITGDGIADFALSNAGIGLTSTAGYGTVQVFSGADFSVVHELWGGTWGGLYPREGLGAFLGGGTDINGDGVADLTATSDWHGVAFFSAISGRTGQILFRLRSQDLGGSSPISPYGTGCTTLGDLDGDGFGEWAVCDPFYAATGAFAGRMLILRGKAGDVESICDGLPHSLGHPARIHFNGPPTEGTRELWIEVSEGVPDAVTQIVFGLEHAATLYGDGRLCIDPQAVVNYAAPVRLDAAGFVRVHADWSRPEIAAGPGAWAEGATWVVQATYADSGGAAGFNATNAVRVKFNR